MTVALVAFVALAVVLALADWFLETFPVAFDDVFFWTTATVLLRALVALDDLLAVLLEVVLAETLAETLALTFAVAFEVTLA